MIFTMRMKRTTQSERKELGQATLGRRLIVALTAAVGLLAAGNASGQLNYATPYNMTTIAGTAGDVGNLDRMNSAARFGFPQGIIGDTNGNFFVADNFENTIRKLTPSGTNWSVTTIAGMAGVGGNANGMNLSAQFNEPTSITIDSSNNLYVADGNNNSIRKITPVGPNWQVSTIAGSGNAGGMDGTNTVAQFNFPSGITVDAAGNVYVADTFSDTIRELTPMGTNWVVTTIAGVVGVRGSADGTNQAALFKLPAAIVADALTNLYVADGNNTIRKMTPMGTNWVVTTISGTAGSGGMADGTNGDAQYSSPSAIAVDTNGNLYVTDANNNLIREISPAGTNWVATTLAGAVDGSNGSADGVGTNAMFFSPYGVAVDAMGNIYVSDYLNDTIRKGVPFVATLPNLAISANGPGSVLVSWPGAYGTLQTNATLAVSNWGDYGGTVNNGGGTNTVTWTPAAGNIFFRLRN